ncbi:MAG: FIG00661252: hypothetical protein [uncultured Acidimicrobiales bacterium]|uniref:DUF3367 domain-containing protein n=1 Tax=uncultured Acidimicrobiales bacterium TaxID=310071 RepID=A0A6J4J0G1_9ACTN|nr:MAG: FIG00661252: hypothetical protein [uncultured Acidimicrobiales bacterium]
MERWPSLVRHLLLAAATYVPLLLTARGRVVADTKSYLYLDPGRLLERAPSMWDPNVGLGTVTHQNIGYLFPMGPWFWAFERLGAPDWVAQRLWLGTIMFAAGAGVLFLLRTLGWGQGPADATEVSGRVWRAVSRVTGGGALAAAVVYMLSPYVLNYGTRLSVLLLPWAGLPWMIGLTQRALRSGSWRHPALFAVVVTIVGGVNATALLLAGIGPLLWVLFAVWVQREVTLRGALAAVARIGVLTLGSSLWWMSGLATQGSYGIDVLRYSETVATVAETSSAPEVLRGLGYWFFYGGEKSGPWIPASRPYMEAPWLIAAGFTLTGLALVAAVVSRWRQRAFFVGLVVIGTAVAVGPHPFQSPSPIGAVFKRLATSSTAGLAMRSTPRAVPLIVLGVAVLLAAGLAGLARVRPRPAVVASLVVMGIAVVGLAPLWSGDALGENLMRDEDVPSYWHEAAAYLDDQGTDTRVLEVPGSDFASYRWGNTVDPITPGLMDRPYVARELIPYGSPASADLLNALDRRFQDDVLDPGVLAPVARRLGAGDIVVRSDLAFEDYRTPRPRALWDQLVPHPEGLAEPVAFGPAVPNRADRFPMQDEVEEAIPRDTPHPPPVGVFEVEDPMPIIRTAAAREPLLLAGDGEGVIQAGAAGLLDGGAPLFYSAATAGDPALREQLLDDGADLVLTDTNRKRGRRWSTVWENTGYTEPAGSEPLRDDISDNRLPLFPAAPDTAFTTVDQRGVREVKASRYGNPVTFTPDDRAANALDGDVETSWSVGDFSPVVGERIVIELDEPVTTDRVELVQPVIGPRDRFITRVEVVLDGESIGTFPLDESSRTAGGQSVDIGEHTFSTIELVVAEDNIGARRAYGTLSPVGFAEVRVADIAVDEVVQLPSDLLDGVGARSAAHDLTVLLERARGRVYISPDEEPSIVRGFGLPSERRFTLEGDARVSAVADEATIDRALGYPAPADGGIAVESSTYLRGNLAARGASALDGDPSTSWRTEFAVHNQIGASLTVGMPGPVTLDRLDLVLLADGDHSVPTRLRIVGGSESRTVEVPAVEDQPVDGATQSVTVSFDPLTTDRLQVVVEAIRPVEAREYYSERPGVLPIGVAELGIPGVLRPTVPAALASPCREDLLELDGEPIGVRVTGSTAEGVARAALALERCGGAADAIPVGAGDHVLRAAPGAETGIDLDRLVLRSDASPQPSGGAAGGTAPRLETVGSGRTSLDLQVSGADGPFWVVLGQSHSPGWTAEVDGGERLGASTLVDGYANGWYVDPRGEQDLALNLEWEPQRRVRAALVVSGAFLVLCLGIVAWGWRRRTPASLPTTSDVELASPLSWGGGRLRPGGAVVLTLAGAAAAALVVSPLAGAVVGATVAAALALQVVGRRGRPVLVGGAIASYGLAVGLILARQLWRGGFDADFEWPSFFPASHVLAWIGLALLAVDVLLDQVEARRRSSPTEQRGQPAEA